jgi:biotin carboxylase
MNEKKDCAIVVGGFSSGSLYAKEFASRGIPPVHVPACRILPALYQNQALAPEFVVDLPFDDEVEHVPNRLNNPPYDCYRPRLVVAGSDQAIERADRLAELLGLPSNVSALSATRRDKFLAAERVRQAGLNAPIQFRGVDPREGADWVASHPEIPRWVVKPTRSAASDRVFQCDTSAEVESAAAKIAGGTNVYGEHDDHFLVQEFLTSATDENEYVVNTCSAIDPKSGEPVHRVVSIYRYEKITLNGAPFIYYARHLLPASGELQKKLSEYYLKCISVLGVRVGPCHGELRMTDRGPALVEVNAGRPDGGGIPELDASCTGHDQVSLTADAFLDPEKFVREARQPYQLKKHGMLAFLPSTREGVFLGMPGKHLLQKLPSYMKEILLVRPGNKVVPTVDVSTQIGWVFLSHESAEQLKNDYLTLRNLEQSGLFEFQSQQTVIV